ncbi:hypothetical protein KC669_04875 [Candidatus Dojkabacteria bacterium]|uniref:Uncharacterized protein n=1 Tax=Candidatus Dojkabacteria bacterium TaxID=2099670 RepID=A0A955RM27_9BACT|nr:hypothetical protein [Candidatus Dojkabacteria bacterium]
MTIVPIVNQPVYIMKTVQFIAIWICFWLLCALLTWIVSPGTDFRVVAGYDGVVAAGIFLGWIPAVLVQAEQDDMV